MPRLGLERIGRIEGLGAFIRIATLRGSRTSTSSTPSSRNSELAWRGGEGRGKREKAARGYESCSASDQAQEFTTAHCESTSRHILSPSRSNGALHTRVPFTTALPAHPPDGLRPLPGATSWVRI